MNNDVEKERWHIRVWHLMVVVVLALVVTFGGLHFRAHPASSHSVELPDLPTLNVLIWSDYLAPEVQKDFEKQYSCHVHIETYNSNEELLTKMNEATVEPDIVVPSSYALENLRGNLIPIEPEKLPHFRNIDFPALAQLSPRLTFEAFHKKGIPYFIAPTGLAYGAATPDEKSPPGNESEKPEWITWDKFRSQAATATLLNEKRETIAAVLLSLGLPADATDQPSLNRVDKQLQEWCNAGLRLNSGTYHYLLFAGQRSISLAYLGDILPLRPKTRTGAPLHPDPPDDPPSPDLHFALPENGFVITCDCLCIPRNAKNKPLAYQFIDYVCDEKVSGKNMLWTLYQAPNRPGSAYALSTMSGSSDFNHPALHLLGAPWAQQKGCVLPELTIEEEERLEQLWRKFSIFREE